jgi:biotin carboxyl carrier protein
MSTRKTAIYLYLIPALMAAALTSCNNAPATSEEEPKVITPVTVVPITYKPVTESIDLPAVTTFTNKSTVRSTTAGTIESVSITIGDNVKKDQLLYTIRTREASAISNSLKGDSTLSFNGRINITSPKEGIISSVSHQNGDYVQEGDELAVISDQNSLVFILDTPFEFVKYVEQNKNCNIQLPDNQIISGTITGKLAEMDPQAQTVRYVIKPVFSGHLPANLNALVKIVKGSRARAEILPKSAVLGNETQTEFWVMKLLNDSVAIKIPITKGFENTEEVEITSPEFQLTDRILFSGSYGLPDTARVKIK